MCKKQLRHNISNNYLKTQQLNTTKTSTEHVMQLLFNFNLKYKLNNLFNLILKLKKL